MSGSSKNHEAAHSQPETHLASSRVPSGQVNPYQSPQVDWLPSPETTYKGNLLHDWAVVAMMVVLNFLGAVAIVPLSMAYAQATAQGPQVPWVVLLIVQLITTAFFASIAIPIGVWLGSRVGLDAPILRGLAKGDFSVLNPKRAGWIAAFIVGLSMGVLISIVDKMLPPEVANVGMNQQTVDAIHSAPAWVGASASFGSSVTEVTWSQFGVMAFLVWFGLALVGGERPSLTYLWIVNLMAIVPTMLMSFFNILMMGNEVTPFAWAYVAAYHMILGLTCGWLYWKYGVESAMASRTISEIVLRAALPLFVNMVT